MTYLKKYGLHLVYTITSIILSLLLITTLNYFNIISSTFYNILKIIILLLNIFISNFILGKKAISKGYLEGLKSSIIIILLLLVFSFLLNLSLHPKIIIYYLIIIGTSILGSMIGINQKKRGQNKKQKF